MKVLVLGGGGREHRMDVVGGREKYGNDVLMVEAIGIDHGLHQGDGARCHLLGVVLVHGGGAAQGPDAPGRRGREHRLGHLTGPRGGRCKRGRERGV